jgi:predicted transcriptional regulator
MDVLYRAGTATAADVLRGLEDPPSYSAVRALLRILEEKGLVRHTADGNRYVYEPAMPRDRASRSALRRVVDVFFGGSAPDALATLMDVSAARLSDTDLERMSRLIEKAKKEGR